MSDRELDVAVAKALGCAVEEMHGMYGLQWACGCPTNADHEYPHGDFFYGDPTGDLRRYSTDEMWAVDLLNALPATVGGKPLVCMRQAGGWRVGYLGHAHVEPMAEASTLSRAACLLALKVLRAG